MKVPENVSCESCGSAHDLLRPTAYLCRGCGHRSQEVHPKVFSCSACGGQSLLVLSYCCHNCGAEGAVPNLPQEAKGNVVYQASESAEDILGRIVDLIEHDLEGANPDTLEGQLHEYVDSALNVASQGEMLLILDAYGDRDLREPAVDLREGWGRVLGQLAANAITPAVYKTLTVRYVARRDRDLRELRELAERYGYELVESKMSEGVTG